MTTENSNIEKKLPSLFDQTRNLIKQAVSSGTDVLKGKPLLATKDRALTRLQICETCEFYKNTRCLKCGCFMEKKVHLESSQCPENKWGEASTQKIEPTSKVVGIDYFPENEREQLIEGVKFFNQTKKPFYIGQKKYSAKINEDGSYSIIIHDALPAATRPNITQGLSPEELVQFNELVQQTKTLEDKTFIFKDVKFLVTINNDKTSVSVIK